MKIKLYNIIIPIWFLMLIPITWAVVLPANFIIDFLVLLMTFKILKINGCFKITKKIIFKTWIIGFFSDFIGVAFLMLSYLSNNQQFISNISLNPFNNIFSLIYVLIAVIISGIAIYQLNLKLVLKNIDITEKQKKIIALTLAIITAPYLFLLPTELLI